MNAKHRDHLQYFLDLFAGGALIESATHLLGELGLVQIGYRCVGGDQHEMAGPGIQYGSSPRGERQVQAGFEEDGVSLQGTLDVFAVVAVEAHELVFQCIEGTGHGIRPRGFWIQRK
ncbi:hypothetical protein D9M68_872020 [compost metagenome]